MFRFLTIFVAVLAFAGTATATPQDKLDRTEAWVVDQLQIPSLDRPIMEGSVDEMEQCGGSPFQRSCIGLSWVHQIKVDKPIWKGLWRTVATPSSLFVLLHEVLHRGRKASSIEEGIVSAVRWDLMPAYTKHMGGNLKTIIRGVESEESAVAVRKASAIKCGCRWKDRGARLIRRQWLAADDLTREQELQAAFK